MPAVAARPASVTTFAPPDVWVDAVTVPSAVLGPVLVGERDRVRAPAGLYGFAQARDFGLESPVLAAQALDLVVHAVHFQGHVPGGSPPRNTRSRTVRGDGGAPVRTPVMPPAARAGRRS